MRPARSFGESNDSGAGTARIANRPAPVEILLFNLDLLLPLATVVAGEAILFAVSSQLFPYIVIPAAAPLLFLGLVGVELIDRRWPLS